MLRAFADPVVTCCDMLGVVEFENGQIFMQHLWMFSLMTKETFKNIFPVSKANVE